ncbi:RNA-dependent RNA polymerase [Farallon virus]|uniref:RNA-directed RNA polymerase L n=2 Tax=Farallon virus TaxID=248053 RepID=A0A191KW96_9VIRU|nr:RNA-dependent RNA polymerase [Farallon virus]AMT75398.1 RNA-dependent RNA polymerase [Farallon virus]
MEDINWQLFGPNLYTSMVKIAIPDFFERIRVKGDGNCFFRAFAYLFFDTEEMWDTVKGTALGYARQHWSECHGAKGVYNYRAENEIKSEKALYSSVLRGNATENVTRRGLDLYLEDATKEGYWGGTDEAEMLASALNVTIVIWNVNTDMKVLDVQKFGTDSVPRAFNIVRCGAHFDALKLINQHGTEAATVSTKQLELSPVAVMEALIGDDGEASLQPEAYIPEGGAGNISKKSTSSSEEVSSADEEDVKPGEQLQDETKTRKELFKEMKEKKKQQDQMRKAMELSAHVPAKVGRVLHKIFNCNVEVSLTSKVLYLLPEGSDDPNRVTLSKIRHIMLDKEGQMFEQFKNCTVVITSGLMEFVNTPELLRQCLPDTGISQYYDIIHPAFVYDILTVSVSILFSSFLYGSDFKTKRKFILNTVRDRFVKPSKVPKLMKEKNNKIIYEHPDKVVSDVCLSLYKEMAVIISKSMKEMPATGLLALRNVYLQSMDFNDYMQVLDDLRVVSYDLDFFNQDELQDIKKLIDCIAEIRKEEEVKPGSLASDWSCIYLSTTQDALFRDSKGKVLKSLRSNGLERRLIQHFFRKKLMFKFISLQGKAYSGGTLNNVLAYCNNLYLTKDQLGFDTEDTEHLSAEMVRIRSLLDDQRVEPIAIICDKLERRFRDLFENLPNVCAEECKSLFEDIRNAENHSSAWKAALRLKGVAYEGFMAKAYNWNYLTEDLKPTLSMIIQTLYPEKFLQFLERTQLCPEQRDLTPDFVMTQNLVIKKDKIDATVETEQLSLDYLMSGTASVIPVSKKTFPLPSEPILEVNRLESVIENFQKMQESKKRDSGLLVESTTVENDTHDKFTYSELLILEVGYQTDIEGKVISDMQKWKNILNLLNFLGIKASVISCADCSDVPSDNWWLPERYVKILKGTISYLFAKLQQNSPSDVSDIVVGAISTQKIRSIIRSGTVVKTPVTIKDLRETWNKNKDKITDRPTGLKLPERIVSAMQLSLIDGVVQEKTSTDEIVKTVEENMEKIAQEVEQTKFKHTLNKDEETSFELLHAWIVEDLKSARCNACVTKILEDCKMLNSLSASFEMISKELILTGHPACCHAIDVDIGTYSLFQRRTGFFDAVNHSETVLDEYDEKQTQLDRLVKLTLPGKTEKERKIKRTVEQLIRVCMELSNIQCIKTPSFQLIIVKKNLKKNIKSAETSKDRRRGLLVEQLERIKKTLSPNRMKSYSDHCKSVIQSVLDSPFEQKGCRSELQPQWCDQILMDLKAKTEDGEIIEALKKTIESKKTLIKNNDKVIVPDWDQISSYLDVKADDLLSSGKLIFDLDCVLFKETLLETISRYFQTPYWECPVILSNLISFLLRFKWYQKLVLYGKICETFLQCCTEFRRSGIKLAKIRHTTCNLAIKLPSNKKENMKCIVYSSNMEALSGVFLLNRRVAVLGASYYYIIVVLFCQCLQHYRCMNGLEDTKKLEEAVRQANAKHLDCVHEQMKLIHQGRIKDASNSLINLCKQNGNFLSRSTRSHFITVFSGLSVTYSALLGDALLTNSQPLNKQIQMLRFGVLNGLSRMSMTFELGKKFSSSCRRMEFYIARTYQMLSVFTCNRFPGSNIQNWTKDDLCPNITMPSVSIYGHFINSDRQLVFDIYNVHIYNKEMDNFDEGTIKVLEETAERHMTWELDLMHAVEKMGEDPKKDRSARLLLCIANVKPSSSSGTTIEDETLSQTSVSSAQSSMSSKKRIKTYFGAMSMKKKPFSFSEDFIVERDSSADFIQTISDKWTFGVYKAKPESVLRDIIEIVRKNPSHTMGSFELLQAFTEFARPKYPVESIIKAKRNPKNYITVSEVTETTSIVSEPRTHASIKDGLRIITGQENKKLVKMLRGKLQSLGLSLVNDKSKGSDLSELLSSVEGLSEDQKKKIVLGITEPSKLTFYTWREIIKMDVECALVTSDGNYIYCWLKSLGGQVKRALKKYIKNLRYDNERFTPKFSLETEILIGLTGIRECYKLIENLKSLTKNEIPPNPDIDNNKLIEVWVKFCELPKCSSEILSESQQWIDAVSTELDILMLKYNELIKLKNDYPSLSFSREEVELRSLETKFVKNNNNALMKLMNCVFYICLCCPWCVHYKSLENFLSKHMDETGGYDFGNETVTKVMEITLEKVWLSLIVSDNCPSLETIKRIVKYTSAMFTGNGRPISCSLNQAEGSINVMDHGQMVDRLRTFLTRAQLFTKELDFIWTCHMITNSNFEVTKRLTGRSTGERLPRSVRSKVVYEMIKVVGESGHAILQQLAFSTILNTNHEFFAVLAPKAQLGGHRDLLVQETGTKLVHATSEMFSRTLLATTNDDGLTNPHLKETILSSALNHINVSRKLHGKFIEEESSLVQFYKVFCISGDNTKWGPIHCCAFFSGMMQQLLKDHPDWSSFYKLVFLKNLYRQVEIPTGSIKKILNAFRYNNSNKKLEELNEYQLRELLYNTIDSWNENPIIKFLVVTYLIQGKIAMRMYNHMGQGIHHATSSILTSIMGDVITHFIQVYASNNFKGLTCSVEHAGSSDDYAKIITLSGLVTKEVFDSYESVFWIKMCRLKNIIAGISRAVQMKDSAKTLCGDAFIEFYSEFMLSHRITPAVIKFIFTGLINSSVTSPQSMSQACQVSSQQAMYNSVPLLTNFAFSLLRQQMFMNHTEYFQRTYGLITMGTLSSFGRLYLPKYSNLTCSSIAIEDSEVISQNLSMIKDNTVMFPGTKAYEEDIPVGEVDSGPASVESSGAGSPSSRLSSLTLGSDTSLKFSQDKALTAVETAYLNSIKPSLSRMRCKAEVEIFQRIFKHNLPSCFEKLKKSSLVNSCEYLREVMDEPWLMIQRIRSIVVLLIAGYYRAFNSDGTEHPVKANLNRDENTVIEDPMIQLIPEKLRRELERLGLAKMTVEELIPTHMLEDDFASLVSKRLVMMNCATENYSSEVSRLKQTLSSRNVIHGLAGGIKELSIPIYTIFLKSYFFKDNVFFKHYDRWNTKHSLNYRDSTGKELKDKIVIKYTTWLDKILNCDVSIDYTHSSAIKSLFDSSLKGVQVIHLCNNTCELSIIYDEVESLQKEFEALALQFSDVNRHKLKILESQRQEAAVEASKAVIVKTTLFSATDAVRIINSPAIVIGYMINESTLSDIKPTKIDMGNLIRDRFRITMFYKTLTDLVSEIVKESELIKRKDGIVELEKVDLYANALTMLCRLVQRSKPRVSSFYIIKGASHGNEPTVSELISYGIQEGLLYILPDCPVETSTYSVRYWKVLQCISAIASLPLSDGEKTSLLSSFLNWKPTVNDLDAKCTMLKYDKAVLEEFNERTLLNVLSSELQSIRNDKERESISDLIEFISSPRQLMQDKPYLGVTSTFRRWGEGQKNGKFTYSSSSGEASGIFINGQLYLTLSKESTALLHEVERKVLEWLCQLRTDVTAAEQHMPFLNLLASSRTCSKRAVDGVSYSVYYLKEDPKFLQLKRFTGKGEFKIVKIKSQILSVRKEVVKEVRAEPHIVWRPSALSIVYDEETEGPSYHHKIKEIYELVKDATGNTTGKLSSIFYKDTRLTLSKINLQDQLYLSSLSLLHCFFCHTLTSSVMEASSKSEILSRYFEQGRSSIIRSANSIQNRLLEVKSQDGGSLNSEEGEICTRLQQNLNKGDYSIDCWAEIQRMLDENGFHRISVSLSPEPSQFRYKWIVSPEFGLSRNADMSDLRDLCMLLSSGIVPKAVVSYMTDDKLFSNLLMIAERIKIELNKNRIDQKSFSALCCSILYTMQNNKKERKTLLMKIGSIYSLISLKEIDSNKGQIRFIHEEDTIQLQVQVIGLNQLESKSIEAKLSSAKAKETKIKVGRNRLISEISSLFEPFNNIKEIMKFSDGFEMHSDDGKIIFTLFFTRLVCERTDLYKLLTFMNVNIPQSTIDLVVDLIMLLFGAEFKKYTTAQTSSKDQDQQRIELNEEITLNDLLAEDDNDHDAANNATEEEEDYNIDDIEFEL